MGKNFLYVLFAIAVLVASWETELTSAAMANPNIPEQSIRIRIIANSERMEDQWIKGRVRDAISADVNQWAGGVSSIGQARAAVIGHMDELGALVEQTLATYGYDYDYKVELGAVPFPPKMFGDQVYAAGNYEALRITLGRGEGQNWWCVLFPPLCFVKGTTAQAEEGGKLSGKAASSHDQEIARAGTKPAITVDDGTKGEVKVRFFVVELFDKIKSKLKKWPS